MSVLVEVDTLLAVCIVSYLVCRLLSCLLFFSCMPFIILCIVAYRVWQESTHKNGAQAGWADSVLRSSPMWDWGGRIKLGAFTAELGTWRDIALAEEVGDTCNV